MRKRPYTELYIHVPFCAGKCGYCSFYSEPVCERDAVDAWLRALKTGAERRAPDCSVLRSVYIGGGTPTLLEPDALSALFSLIHAEFGIAGDAEITIECNPESLTGEKAAILAENVNRVSMGVQSFSPRMRESIGRKGSPETVGRAVGLLRENGIDNIGFDLIYANPGETREIWEADLREALAYSPRHISCYSLMIEEGTPLAEKKIVSDDDTEAAMWEFAGDFLGANGLPRYEISNHARPGFECRHNINVWLGAAYLGLGPAAASFDGAERQTEAAPLGKWLAGAPSESDRIPDGRRLAELFIMGLRRTAGWTPEEWARLSSEPWTELWPEEIGKNMETGLLALRKAALVPTERGLACWNDIAEDFL